MLKALKKKMDELHKFLACLMVATGTAELIVNNSNGEKYLARLENDMARLNAAYERVKETLRNGKVQTD